MAKFIDLTGQKFGRLTVISRASNKRTSACWWCQCDCGNNELIPVLGHNLLKGNTRSCGCLQKESVLSLRDKNKKYNDYNLDGEYGIGYTSNGDEFYFDLEDYDKIKDYCWTISAHGYVVTGAGRFHIQMHNIVLDTPEGYTPDHIHGKDTRNDNRKSNLRAVDKTQNQMNMGLKSNNKSGITGVYWDTAHGKWKATIQAYGKRHNLGTFINFEDAVKARKEAEQQYFGEFAYDVSQTI